MINLDKSPYLKSEQRLGDVIAAIQAMGIYKFYLGTFKSWAKRISGDEKLESHWKKVFQEHPEFFRLDAEKQQAGLVLRRQRTKRYNTDTEELITKLEFMALDRKAKNKISREPLTPDQIGALIDVAIKMHARASEQARDRRWWIPPGLAFIGALAGAFISKLL